MYLVGLTQAEDQDRPEKAEHRRVVFTAGLEMGVPRSCRREGVVGVAETVVVVEHPALDRLALAEALELPEMLVEYPEEVAVAVRRVLVVRAPARQAPIRRARGAQDLAPGRLRRGRAMVTEVALAAATPRRNQAGAAELCLAEILRMVNLPVAKVQPRQTKVEALATLRRPEATLHRAQGLNPI